MPAYQVLPAIAYRPLMAVLSRDQDFFPTVLRYTWELNNPRDTSQFIEELEEFKGCLRWGMPAAPPSVPFTCDLAVGTGTGEEWAALDKLLNRHDPDRLVYPRFDRVAAAAPTGWDSELLPPAYTSLLSTFGFGGDLRVLPLADARAEPYKSEALQVHNKEVLGQGGLDLPWTRRRHTLEQLDRAAANDWWDYAMESADARSVCTSASFWACEFYTAQRLRLSLAERAQCMELDTPVADEDVFSTRFEIMFGVHN